MAVTLGSLQTEGGGDGTRQSVTQAGTNSQTVSASRRCRERARSGRQLPSSSLEGRSEGRGPVEEGGRALRLLPPGLPLPAPPGRTSAAAKLGEK